MADNKQLILTYGVSDGRQRTVVLPLKRVNFALAMLACVVAWSLASAGYLLLAGFRTEATARAVVAQAPSPSACPQPKPMAVPVCEPAKVEVSKVEEPKAEETTAPLVVGAAPESSVTATPTVEVPAAEVPAAEVPAADAPALEASLEDYRTTEQNGKLVAHFAVRNLTRETLRGRIVAEADFVMPDGTTQTVAAEESYKARTLSSKRVSFETPDEGKLDKVRIKIEDEASQRAVVFFK